MKTEKLPQLANFLDGKIAEMKGLLTKKGTYFNNPCLKNCKIVSYNQGQYNKFLRLDDFDEVFWISNTGNYINAIGYLNRTPTILKLKKNDMKNTYNNSVLMQKAIYQERLAISVGMRFNRELYIRYLISISDEADFIRRKKIEFV